MKLLQLYKAILKTANLVVTEDGYVSRDKGNSKEPAMIKGKRLVLPTPEQLRNGDWKDRIVFHPLSENVLRGESAVLEDFRRSINMKLNINIGMIAYQLLLIASSPALHPKLTPDQSEFLSKVKHADEKTMENFMKLMKAMKTTEVQRAFVSIYLKRGGLVHGKKHMRVGVVTFPLYEELLKGNEVYGVKLRVKDVDTFKALFEYMIPGIEKGDAHNRGSDSDVAPYLDSLMKALIAVAAPLNDLVDLFHNQFDNPDADPDEDAPTVCDTLRFDDSWVEAFDNLNAMINEIRLIPMQAGNEGASPNTAVTTPTHIPATPTSEPTPHIPAILSQPTNWQPQPAAVTTSIVRTANGLDFNSVMVARGLASPTSQSHFNPMYGAAQPPRASFSQPQGQQTGWQNQNNGWGNNSFGGSPGYSSSGL